MSRPAIQQNEESRQYRLSRLRTVVQKLTQSLLQEWNKKDTKTPGNVETLRDVRTSLCINLSDLILCDPKYAKTNNLVDKLWKNCFYVNRVDLQRAKITKCQFRINKIQRQNPSDQTNTIQTDGNQNQKLGNQSQDVAFFVKMKSDTKEELNLVLKEGLDCFHPLFEKLQRLLLKLVKPNSELLSSCQDTTQPFMLSGSYDNAGDCDEYLPESSDGIVDCLRRIQVIIGDTYRYLDSNEAKVWYESSTWLAPGFGHAFNQLGVISQHPFGQHNHPEMKLLHSLYWYSRAILAQEQGLRLASSNMERLFFENMQLCQKYKNQKGTNAFLTNFIDMHYKIFLLLGPSASAASKPNDYQHDYTSFKESDAPSLLEESINQSFSMLPNLLNKKTSLSDKLLVKLAVIQAFSVTYKGVNNVSSDHSKAHTYYAQKSTFKFAECLAERIITAITKQGHNFSDNSTNVPTSSPITLPSVRFLLPFMLVTEYLFLLAKQDSTDMFLFKEFDHFWKLLIKIANHYTQLASIFDLTATDDDDDTDDQDQVPDEYKALRGYIPFQPFIQQLNPDGLLTDQEAADLLDSRHLGSNDILTPQSAGSKESYGTKSTRSQDEQNRCKIKRFLSVCEMIASCSEINIVINATDGTFIWIEDGQEENLDENDSQSITLNPSSDIDDQVIDMMRADERIENASNAEDTTKYTGLFDNSFNDHQDDGEEYDNASNGSTRTFDPDEVCNDHADIEVLTNRLVSEVAIGNIQIHMEGSIEDDPIAKIIPTTANQECEIERPNGDLTTNLDVDATSNVNARNESSFVDAVAEEESSHPTDTNCPDPSTNIIVTTTNRESENKDLNGDMGMNGDVDAIGDANATNESTVVDAVVEEKISHPTGTNCPASPKHCSRLPSPSHLEANEETEVLSMPTVKGSLSFETVDTGNDTVTETTEVGFAQQHELHNLEEDTMLCATELTNKMSTVPSMQQDSLSRSELKPKPLSQKPSFTMATTSSSQNHTESLGPDLFSWRPPKKRGLLDILGDPDTFGGTQAYRTRNPFVNPIFHSDKLTKEQIMATRPKSEVSISVGHPRPRFNPLFDSKPDFSKPSSTMTATSFSHNTNGLLEPDLFSWQPPKKSRLLDILADPDTFGGPKAYRTRNPFVNPIFHSDELTKEQIIAARPKPEIIMDGSRPRWNRSPSTQERPIEQN